MLLPCPGSDQYSMPADILLHPGSVKFWPRKHGSSSWCVLSEENHHGWVCRGSLWTSSPIFPNRYLRFALTALPTPTSFVFAALLTVLTFAGMQMFKNNLASSEWMTILGGFIGSQLFIFLLTVSFSLVTSRSMALNSTIGWIYLIPAISDFVILRQSFTQYGISLFQQYKFCSVLHRVSEISVYRDVLPELKSMLLWETKVHKNPPPPPPPPPDIIHSSTPPPPSTHTHTRTHTRMYHLRTLSSCGGSIHLNSVSHLMCVFVYVNVWVYYNTTVPYHSTSVYCWSKNRKAYERSVCLTGPFFKIFISYFSWLGQTCMKAVGNLESHLFGKNFQTKLFPEGMWFTWVMMKLLQAACPLGNLWICFPSDWGTNKIESTGGQGGQGGQLPPPPPPPQSKNHHWRLIETKIRIWTFWEFRYGVVWFPLKIITWIR